MKEYKKVIVLDEDGTEEEYEKAIVISIMKEDRIGMRFTHIRGLDFIRAAYAFVTAVDELGMMPFLKKMVNEGKIVIEDVQIS